MQLAPLPFDEPQRLNAVHRLKLLDSEPEERFNRITRIVHHLFAIPFVFITLVDANRLWFKSVFGCDEKESPRDVSICGHTICNTVTEDRSSRLFEIVDTTKDKRFWDNSFVIDTYGVRYYLGFALQSIDRYNIGTLCMIDSRPRTFSPEDKQLFSDIGLMVESELNYKLPHFNTTIDRLGDQQNNEENVIEEHADKFLKLSYKLDSVKYMFDGLLKIKGINYKEWRVLNAIVETELASPHLLSKKLGISPPLMTKKLETLETKRLIERWNSKDGDRRFVHIACTKRGKELWRKGIEEVNQLGKVHLADIIFY